jgi:Peptidase family S41
MAVARYLAFAAGALALLALGSVVEVDAAPADADADRCVMDLETLPSFLLENDAGAKDEMRQFGPAHFAAALSEARAEASTVADAQACANVLKRYLRSYRSGHLSIKTLAAATPWPATTVETDARDKRPLRVPTVTMLSRRTALLRIPSFAAEHREPLVQLLAAHRTALASRRNWIVDVRSNGGGSDSTFEPLLPWLVHDETVNIGAQWLVTPANIAAQRRVCSIVAPTSKECEAFTATAIERMRTAPPGTYVLQEEGEAVRYQRPHKREPRGPTRVAILIDRSCGSSCEEFVLAVRQSFSVKLLGRRTAGSLDYSNLRPYDLPSGERQLWYATSRSKRIPDMPVDVAGIQPDIYLPAPADGDASAEEVRRVQRWLEGGSLAPVAR